MILFRKTTDVTNHLNRASVRKTSGIYTVTAARRDPDYTPRPSPFGKLVLGPDAGARPTAYKPILGL